MLNSIPNIINKNLILGGDFNLFFDTSLKTQDRNPILKKKSLAKLIEIKKTLDLYDIWRVRNTKSKRSIFHQNDVSGCIKKKVDYSLFSNFLQESVIRADVLVSFYGDHSPIIFAIEFESNNRRGKGPCKFKSLLPNDECTYKLKNHISESLSSLDQNGIRDYQISWEYIKFEMGIY